MGQGGEGLPRYHCRTPPRSCSPFAPPYLLRGGPPPPPLRVLVVISLFLCASKLTVREEGEKTNETAGRTATTLTVGLKHGRSLISVAFSRCDMSVLLLCVPLSKKKLLL